MKKKKLMIAVMAILIIVVAVLVVVTQSPKWSKKSFEAVIKETIMQPDGEIRLIVERTTEIYSNSFNSLHISEETELVGMDGVSCHLDIFSVRFCVPCLLFFVSFLSWDF